MGEKRISDEELIAELRRLALDLDKTPTVRLMKERGEYSDEVYRTRFGSWNAALDEAGLRKNRNIPEEELLEAMQEFAAELGRAPTQREMNEDGPHSVTVYQERFGGWSKAKEAANLSTQVLKPALHVSDSQLLEDIRRVADELGGEPLKREMEELGEFDPSTAEKRFGDWGTALEIADVREDPHRPVPKLVLLIELRALADLLGRPPHVEDLQSVGEFSVTPYERAFGGFSRALREAGVVPNYRPRGEGMVESECVECGKDIERPKATVPDTGHVFCSRDCFTSFKSRYYSGENHWAWEGHDTGYGPNWGETRKEVLERDNHQCQECGITEEEHISEFGHSLHIHHIQPRAEFDDLEEADRLDNLIALCRACHLDVERKRRGE